MRSAALLLLNADFRPHTQPLRRRCISKSPPSPPTARGKVYKSPALLPGTAPSTATLSLHGHPPMQSTFKFPLAMAVFCMRSSWASCNSTNLFAS